MKRRLPSIIAGTIVVIVVVIVGVAFLFNGKSSSPQSPAAAAHNNAVTLTVIGGSEKSELMADPDVQKVLKDTYGLTVAFTPMGSYAQVQLKAADLKMRHVDALWPSSASAQAVFEATSKGSFTDYKAESVLQSPEVIYAGPNATDALTKVGIVKRVGQQYYLVNLKSLLLNYTLKNKQWGDLNAHILSGPVKIGSTDPAKSNSGFTMAQLELNVVATDNVFQAPSLAEAKKALPTVRALYDAQGLQASSSDFGFKEWLLQGGELRSPLYAGYENQLIQFAVQNKGNASVSKQLSENVRLLYPQPTIYNEHPVLALTPAGNRLITAMKDPKIQDIAWQKYGFRSGTTVGANDVSIFKTLDLAQNLQVTNAPNADVTKALLDCLGTASMCK